MEGSPYVWGVAAGAALTVAGCGLAASQVQPDLAEDLDFTPHPSESQFLSRAGYGARPGDAAALARQGRESWIEEQLQAAAPEPLHLTLLLSGLDALRIEGWELGDMPEDALIRQLQSAAIYRATHSPNQLRERLAEFFSDHFNIHAKKASGVYLLVGDQESVIRKHLLGRFEDMLLASAQSPAMLNYLDNKVNRRQGVNENYAREILELHTLGVHGGYSQRDVRALARVLSGWTIETRAFHPRGRFRFDPDTHDVSAKVVLGKTFTQPGPDDGLAAVRMLARHPSTAHFLATKLCRFFTGEVHPRLIESMAQSYLSSATELKPMLRILLTSPEMDGQPGPARRPFDYMVACLRAVGASTAGPELAITLRNMGQPLYEWPMPDGFPVDSDAWTGSLLARWNFAIRLLDDDVRGVRVPWDALKERAGWDKEAIARRILSPEFQWRSA